MTFEELLQTNGFRAMDLSREDISFIRLGWNAAILAERERCAKIAEESMMPEHTSVKSEADLDEWESLCNSIAAEIRSGK